MRCLVWLAVLPVLPILRCLVWIPAAWCGFRVAWSGFLCGLVWLLALPGLASVGSSCFLHCLVWLRALPCAASCIALFGLLDCTIWFPALPGLAPCVASSGRCLVWFPRFYFVRSLCFGIGTQRIGCKKISSSAKEIYVERRVATFHSEYRNLVPMLYIGFYVTQTLDVCF